LAAGQSHRPVFSAVTTTKDAPLEMTVVTPAAAPAPAGSGEAAKATVQAPAVGTAREAVLQL
jgi:hypothetical protein